MTRQAWGFLAVAAAVVGAAPAHAQTIGVAATVRNDVAQLRGAKATPINAGEEVVRNEVVRTGVESATKIVFRDDTNLAVGPSSTVTLDRFVFSGENTAQKVTVNLVRGAFRFTSGGSDKRAYEIKTPLATIGVRGTQLGVLSEGRLRTTVNMLEGVAIICMRGTGRCLVASMGQTVVVTATGITFSSPGGPRGFDFAAWSGCGSDPSLCTPTQFASLARGAYPGLSPLGNVAALCGR